MKSKILLLTLVLAIITSCSQDSESEVLQKNESENLTNNRLVPIPGDEYCKQVDLIAGQNYDSGNVDVSIDAENLLITYTTEENWELIATHLYAGNCEDRPANNPGNPLIGQFPLSATHDIGTVTYTYSIPLATLSNCICIAAHAEVKGPSGKETAWGNGLPYGGSNWAMYFELCIDQCGL